MQLNVFKLNLCINTHSVNNNPLPLSTKWECRYLCEVPLFPLLTNFQFHINGNLMDIFLHTLSHQTTTSAAEAVHEKSRTPPLR